MATNDLDQLCKAFSGLLNDSKHCVFYTGAGISTSAEIPDFRSPNGLYEQFKNSGTVPPCVDISTVRPSYTHMAIKALVDEKYVQHVVSQNCDGLHIRSGLLSEKLSEIHGNMFVEMCLNCEPPATFVRHFDTTAGTSYRRHKVAGADSRPCSQCGTANGLHDSVVHCGEYARHEASAPYRWPEAGEAAANADLIVCIGSSLQVLKSYASLWSGLRQRRAGKPKAKLVIINLQPTAKDKQASMLINHCCERVLRATCHMLGVEVPEYDCKVDPIHLSSLAFRSNGPPPTGKLAIERRMSSPTQTQALPGWMRATVDQLRRARERQQRSRRVSVFKSRKKNGKKKKD